MKIIEVLKVFYEGLRSMLGSDDPIQTFVAIFAMLMILMLFLFPFQLFLDKKKYIIVGPHLCDECGDLATVGIETKGKREFYCDQCSPAFLEADPEVIEKVKEERLKTLETLCCSRCGKEMQPEFYYDKFHDVSEVKESPILYRCNEKGCNSLFIPKHGYWG